MQHFPRAIWIVILFASVATAQPPEGFNTPLTTDPGQAPFVYDDIYHFVAAFELLTAEADTVAILQREYFDQGTPGLKMFVQKYDLTVQKLAEAIAEYPDDYAALGDMVDWLQSQEMSIRRAFADLQQYIPNIVYPPTYYLIEAHRGIGSASVEGQLISVEKNARQRENQHLDTFITHELVHFQQAMAVGYEKYIALYGPEKNLLGLTVREGTAEFFAKLITGRITQDDAWDYVMAREAELWKEYRTVMHGRETGDWMWQKPADPDQPYHTAYVIGCRVVEAYYRQGEDKAATVADILAVTDYPAFLVKSGYAQRFGN